MKKIVIFGFVFMFLISGVFADLWNGTTVSNNASNMTVNIDDAINASSIITNRTNQIVFEGFTFYDQRYFTLSNSLQVNSLAWLNFTNPNFLINTSQLINGSGHLAFGEYPLPDSMIINNLPAEINSYYINISNYTKCDSSANCTLFIEGEKIYLSNQPILNGTYYEDGGTFLNKQNLIDFNRASYSELTWNTVSSKSIGRIFNETSYIGNLQIKAGWSSSGAGISRFVYLDKYNGSTWTNVASKSASGSSLLWDATVNINDDIKGLRFRFDNPNTDIFTAKAYFLNVSQEHTFNTNGNQTYSILAKNGTQTQNLTGTLLVNPYQYFRMKDVSRNMFATEYLFGNYSSIGEYVKIPLYDLGLGSHSKEFYKFGYERENKSFSFTSSSALNQTFNVTALTITVKVYDETNPSTQLTFNLTINNGTNATQYLNQVNFSKFYNETPQGNLTLTIESESYSMRKVFTALNPNTAVSHIVYLIPDADSTPAIFRAMNLAQTEGIEDVVFSFDKEFAGIPTFVAQAKTDSQGYTYFNMDILEDYQITISKNGYVSQVINSIPGKSDYVILMEESGTAISYLYEDFSYKLTPKSSKNKLPFNVSADVFDEASLISSMRFTVTGDNTSETQILTSANGGEIIFTIENASAQYTLNLSVMREGQQYDFIEKVNYYEQAPTNASLEFVAEELNGEENNADRVFIMIIIYIVAVALGSLFSPSLGAVFGLLPITLFAIPAVGWITPGIAALFYVFTILGVLYFER